MALDIELVAAFIGSVGALASAFKSLLLIKEARKERLYEEYEEGVRDSGQSLADKLRQTQIDAWRAQGKSEAEIQEKLKAKKGDIGAFNALPRRRTKGHEDSTKKLMVACSIVVVVFALSVGVLWCLTRIGPIAAQVEASIKKLGGSVWIAGGGLFGCFFAIALLAFGAIYVFGRSR